MSRKQNGKKIQDKIQPNSTTKCLENLSKPKCQNPTAFENSLYKKTKPCFQISVSDDGQWFPNGLRSLERKAFSLCSRALSSTRNGRRCPNGGPEITSVENSQRRFQILKVFHPVSNEESLNHVLDDFLRSFPGFLL